MNTFFSEEFRYSYQILYKHTKYKLSVAHEICFSDICQVGLRKFRLKMKFVVAINVVALVLLFFCLNLNEARNIENSENDVELHNQIVSEIICFV